MKTCPKCQKSYADDNLNYCLDDGAALLPGDQAPPTVVMSPPRATADPVAAEVPLNQGRTTAQQVGPKQKTSKAWIWVLLILGVVMLLCGGGIAGFILMSRDGSGVLQGNVWPSPRLSPSASPTASSTTPDGEFELTLANYNRLEIGMSRADVERILGGEGTELSSSSGGGMDFAVIQWEGEGFDSVIVSFQNEKVIAKSQVGLNR